MKIRIRKICKYNCNRNYMINIDMRNHLNVIALSLFLVATGFSQERAQWSKEYERNGHYEILTERDGMLYLSYSATNTPFYDQGSDMNILKVDATSLNLVKDISVNNLEDHEYYGIQTVSAEEGLAHIYFHRSKNKQWVVSAQIYDYSNLERAEVVDLAKFDILSNDRNVGPDVFLEESRWPYGFVLSGDKRKMAVYSYQEKVTKGKQTLFQYAVIDLADSLKVLHQDEYLTAKESNHYRVKDMHLSDDGALYYLEKSYVDDRDLEFVNKKPAYIYSIIKLSGDSTDYIYDIAPKGDFIDNLKVGTGQNGQVYAAGYLSEKPFDEKVGMYFLSLDDNGYKVAESRESYSSRAIETIRRKEKDDLNKEYRVVDIMANGGVVYVVKQYRDVDVRRQMVNNFGGINRANQWQSTTTFYYENMIIEAMNPVTGDLMWIAVNPRDNSQMIDNLSPFMISTQFFLNENLYIVYNDKIENLERIRSGNKIKGANVPGDKVVPVVGRIDKMGRVDYISLDTEEEKSYVPYGGVFVGNSDLYFVRSRNFRDMKIGKIALTSIK